MKLVIVESPTKAKTLGKFLGSEYEVLSSKGHIYDLPKKEIGVDVENNFTPKYEALPGKNAVIAALKKAAKKAEVVYLVTDPDREGESIAWHIREVIGGGKTKRVSFHEITEDVVKEAFNHPQEINQDLVDSQQARRVLDRLVGYKLSPLLWKKVKFGLSAGRVQSVAVRLIVEREREREAFHPEEYWEIAADLKKKEGEGSFTAQLLEKDGQKLKIGLKEDADQALAELKSANFQVSKVEQSSRKRYPFPPLTTSSLQQAGVNLFGFSGKRTMRAAQSLYEAGLITYHRTDSTILSATALSQIRDLIEKDFGKEYLPESPIQYKTKSRLSQEAHEAIRPTLSSRKPGNAEVEGLGSDQQKLYDLIWRRAMASQMLPALYEKVGVNIQAGPYGLRATGSKRLFPGWEAVSPSGENGEKDLPSLKDGEDLDLVNLSPSQHFTEPPARYTEATLIKKLEEEGIGRPSTYAPTISTIMSRNYISKDGRSLKPEDFGFVVTEKVLVPYFPDIVGLDFTAKMEANLDEIAQGKMKWVEPIAAFYGPFAKELAEADENIDKSSMTTLAETDEKCPESGHPLVLKLGRYGKFYSCSGFPECKYARPYVEKIGMACPTCKEGDVIVKKTKRGKSFYGCSRYPSCKFASWDDPRRQKEEKEKTAR
ncbi:MAG: type I DNA topoisomerase [Patescibacteria group bacterium]